MAIEGLVEGAAGSNFAETSDVTHKLRPDVEEDKMRLKDACIGAVVAAALAIGGCSSKAELTKATSDLAAVTAERNGLEAQLDAANNKNAILAAKVAELTTKANAAYATQGKPAHMQAAREKAAKTMVHTSSKKSKA
jgi:outer membrane murein-binding lipoprotein Lpp